MVDTLDIFAKLRSGASFTINEINSNHNFLKSSISHGNQESKDRRLALDFFGTNEVSITKAPELTVEPECSPDSDIDQENSESCHGNKMKRKKKQFTEERREELRKEKINFLRNHNGIHVQGADVPDPLTNFDYLKKRFRFSDSIIQNVVSSGYVNPTPVQMQAIPLLLNLRDCLVCAPTGSGKTLAYILPILHCLKKPMRNGFRAVIVAPTRELANQIWREFDRMSAGKSFRIHVLTKSKALSGSLKSTGKFDILITTPKRLVYLLHQDPPQIQLQSVEWLVLDEVDKLFEEGKNGFREQVAIIMNACDNANMTKALFSATLANQVEEWCHSHLDNFVRVTIGARNTATEDVKQELLFVGQENGKLIALRDVFRSGFHPPILVFVQSKERAKELFNELIYHGINVDVIHSDRTQAQRDGIVKSFRTGKLWVLIATELMGRGIDFKGINLVINYDFPPTAVSYIHRIGRTGRAGRPGSAVTFFTEGDIPNLKSIANVVQASGCEIPDWIKKLKKPKRSRKKALSKVPPKRNNISSAAKFLKMESQKKRKIRDAAKRKNVNLQKKND